VGIFFLKMNTFYLIFHDYQSRESEKSENHLFICLRCPVFTLFVKEPEQLRGRCDRVLRDCTGYARVKKIKASTMAVSFRAIGLWPTHHKTTIHHNQPRRSVPKE
jgi:hypothetical protein